MKSLTPTPLFQSASSIKNKFDISTKALQVWSQTGKLETVRLPGGKRLYSTSSLNTLLCVEEEKKRLNICYARVSSAKQAGDLQRQVETLQQCYPEHKILQDVGSGLNWKRAGFLALLEQVCSDEVSEVVVLDKDRLCRFGFELVEWICKKHSTRITVHNHSARTDSTDELAEDLLAVVNFFVARSNGRRAARNMKQRRV